MSLWPFSSTPRQIVDGAIDVIQTISPVAAQRVRQRVNLMSQVAVQDLGTLIQSADNLAYSINRSWIWLARAWILTTLLFEWSDNAGNWYPDQQPQRQTRITNIRQRLNAMQDPAIRNDLHDMLSGEPILRRIHIARRNVQRAAWNPGFFTDPRQHDIHSFRYLIHAMCPTINLPVPEDAGRVRSYYFEHYGRFLSHNGDLSVAELYLAHPEMIQLELLSCSLIDENHTSTYRDSPFGLILRAPSGNICDASANDISAAPTQNLARGAEMIGHAPLVGLMQVDRFLRLLCGAYERQLPTPMQVLNSPNGHNEVLVLGKFDSDVVTVCGLFIKVTARLKILQSFVEMDTGCSLMKAMLQCSATLHIPIVPIIEVNGIGSVRDYDQFMHGQKAPEEYMPPMGLTVGRTGATWRDHEVTREYDYHGIARRASQLLLANHTPRATHEVLHDEGIPHQVIEEVMRQMGYEDYL